MLNSAIITKSICLHVVSTQYDIIGIASPLTIMLKVYLKELYQLAVGWDEPLEGELRAFWVSLFETLARTGSVKFHRATRPEGAVGACMHISMLLRWIKYSLCSSDLC